jgi:hypothetical protein
MPGIIGAPQTTIWVFAFNNPGDTLYGWLLWGNGHSVIRSYAFQSSAVAISENDWSQPALSVFPNPCINKLSIEALHELAEIIFCDVNGRQLVTEFPHTKIAELNLENVSNGIYFLRVKTENTIITRKIVVQH